MAEARKRAAGATPIRANGYLLAHDYVLEMLKRLRDGVTVTPYVLEPHDGEGKPIRFELRVTQIGDQKVPSIRKPAARA